MAVKRKATAPPSDEFDNSVVKCIIHFANGDKLECELKNGRPEGKGVKTFESKDLIVCDGWKDGKANGKGKLTGVNGDVYEGEFKNDERNGKGVYKYSNGGVFEGEWKDGHRQGKGVYKYANVDVLESDWKDNCVHGKGVHTFAKSRCV
jgi:hypothetical protein